MRRSYVVIGSVSLAAVVVVMAFLLWPGSGVMVTGERMVSFSAHVALAVSEPTINGNGTEVQLDRESPIIRRGGLPLKAVSYEDGITVEFSDPGLEDIHFGRQQLNSWAKNRTIAEAEAIINEAVQEYLEVWILLGDICDTSSDYPVCQEPPVLLDNERIDRRTGKDYLVVTIGYFAVHLYDMTFMEGSFITRLNGLEAGPIEGEWWL